MPETATCRECGAHVALTDEGLLSEHLMPNERAAHTFSNESGQAPCGSSGTRPEGT